MRIADAVITVIKGLEQRLSARIEALEQREIEAVRGPEGPPGRDGKDADPVDLDAIVQKAVALIPVPKDGEPGPPGESIRGEKGEPGLPGKDAPPVDIDDVVLKAAALIPVPKDGKDGRDGKDVTVEQLTPVVSELVTKAVDAIPKPRDGRDGLPGGQGDKGLDGKDGINGKDGVDGLGFDDIEVDYDGERSFTLKFVQGERVKTFGSFTLPIMIYRGVFQVGKSYERGDTVTWGGASWVASQTTTAKPGENGVESRAWQLAVKKGTDGKAGPPGKDGKDVIVRTKNEA